MTERDAAADLAYLNAGEDKAEVFDMMAKALPHWIGRAQAAESQLSALSSYLGCGVSTDDLVRAETRRREKAEAELARLRAIINRAKTLNVNRTVDKVLAEGTQP